MENLTGATLHLGGGAAGKSEQEDAPRIGSAADQMAHAVGKRVGLARARARDDQERAAIRCIASVLDGATLPDVEGVEIVVLGGRIVPRRRGGIVLFAKHGAAGQGLIERTFDEAYHGSGGFPAAATNRTARPFNARRSCFAPVVPSQPLHRM